MGRARRGRTTGLSSRCTLTASVPAILVLLAPAVEAGQLGRSAAWCGVILMLAPETIAALIAGAVAIVLAIIAVLALDRFWPPLLRREFTVDLPAEEAWRHLAHVEQWPSWAKHIKQVEVQPPGELVAQSTGRLLLTNGLRPVFRMSEFAPYRSWKWVGGFLWLTIYYDHRFEELKPTQTELTFELQAKGFGVSLLGRLFAQIYCKSLDRAIPLLVQEMNASRSIKPVSAPDAIAPGSR